MKLFDGKRITVAGLGVHGGAVGNIRWLHDQGARITVTDLKSAEELADGLAELHDLHDITWVLGQHRQEDFTDTDMVLRNPAMPRRSPYLEAAREAGVRIEMDSSLFLQYSPTRNIIGVTGSKGKTTATLAISHLMQLVFPRVATLGVEQSAPLPAISELTQNDLAVFELSSWRLEALDEKRLSPHTAIVTSLYHDHLNTYDSFDDYLATKQTIMRYQATHDRLMLNYDDPLQRAWRRVAKARVAWFTMGSELVEEGICVRRNQIMIKLHRQTLGLFSVDAIPRASVHERRNILPAIYLAFVNGARIESIRMHLNDLGRAAHRLETVRTLHGVPYINDSAATIPDATIAALDAMGQQYVVLILGGSDKKLEFDALARRARECHIRALIFLPGNATPYMQEVICGAFGSSPPVYLVDSMPEAVQRAHNVAQRGDVVLLSPGATSFGLFKHEFDRGDQFKTAVQQLQ